MTYPPPQPPVMHGYPAQPPNNDWKPPPAKRRATPWIAAGATVAALALAAGIAVAVDNATLTPQEMPADAQRVCVEEYVPAKLAAMADPKTARFAGVTVTSDAGTYVVKGRVTADRVSLDRFDGMPNRYRFECSMTRTDDEWARGYATVLPI
jgi:alkanesulfonate monooxygenase SsuD/methylene tetrahydromethanopterin reductase-like flavin-dependent oxidoreductase (luciferase family)